jgi:hypothetical protein
MTTNLEERDSEGVKNMRQLSWGNITISHTILMASVFVIITVIVTVIACLIFINNNRVWIKYHPSDKTPLDQIGSFIGGISLFFATLVAWITAYLVTEKNARLERYASAVGSFRVLYDEFWRPDVAVSRKWIISSCEYEANLVQVLKHRNSTVLNELGDEQNTILETLDRFLSVLVRIKSFSVSGELSNVPSEQLRLWRKVIHGSFWIKYAYDHRPDLWTYLYRHWREELLPPGAPELPDPTKALEFEGLL